MITTPEISAVRDADRIIGLLEAAELSNPKLIVNRLCPEMVRKGDMLDIDDIIDILAIDIMGVVPEDQAIVISSNKGEPVVFDLNSPAGLAYRKIAQRIMGEAIPLTVWEAEVGLLAKLKTFGLMIN